MDTYIDRGTLPTPDSSARSQKDGNGIVEIVTTTVWMAPQLLSCRVSVVVSLTIIWVPGQIVPFLFFSVSSASAPNNNAAKSSSFADIYRLTFPINGMSSQEQKEHWAKSWLLCIGIVFPWSNRRNEGGGAGGLGVTGCLNVLSVAPFGAANSNSIRANDSTESSSDWLWFPL